VQVTLGLFHPAANLIVVGGTNGKGSVVALLESIYRAAGYRVGTYTSPHLLRYNERVRLNGREAGDGELCDAFDAVEQARGDTTLTYFEFGTLAAAWLFARQPLDVAILEVGLGGRLDAVNIFEPEVAVVTSIGIDHTGWLGDTREAIGFEKAGIFRAGRAAVCGDANPPASLIQEAERLGAIYLQRERDFGFRCTAEACQWRGPASRRSGLPPPALPGAHQHNNAATAIMAVETLQEQLPVDQAALRQGLLHARIAGRLQAYGRDPVVLLDVAHNPQAVTALRAALEAQPVSGKTLAVLGMMRDKDVAAVTAIVAPLVHHWYLASQSPPRGATVAELAAALPAGAGHTLYATPQAAFAAARRDAGAGDRIVAFGSFETVGAIMRALS
jgi:dihydrofolate synthase/folylpolyglutamate synthase